MMGAPIFAATMTFEVVFLGLCWAYDSGFYEADRRCLIAMKKMAAQFADELRKWKPIRCPVTGRFV